MHKKNKIRNVNFLQRNWNRINENLNQVDIFGEPIQLRYKGKTTITSSLGGLMSLIFYLGLIFTSLQKFDSLRGGIQGTSEISIENVEVTNGSIIELQRSKFRSKDVKFGVNVRNGQTFDNDANPYFVFRAYSVDNELSIKQSIDIQRTVFNDKNHPYSQKWYSETF